MKESSIWSIFAWLSLLSFSVNSTLMFVEVFFRIFRGFVFFLFFFFGVGGLEDFDLGVWSLEWGSLGDLGMLRSGFGGWMTRDLMAVVKSEILVASWEY